MSLKQMQFLDGASAIRQEPVRIMGFDCVCGRRMEISAEQGVVPAPQRTWFGLTDEDKQIAFDDTQEGGGFWEFAEAIEAKLKEKNT
jgi:hypothetical protein